MVPDPIPARVALGYVRVSTEEQNLGPEAQREQIATFAERSGLAIVGWFEDRVSGALAINGRPELENLLERLAGGGIGFVIVAKRDRIARDVVVAAAVTKAIESAGARLLSADGVSSEDTPEGKLVRLILDAFAEFERLQIGARTRAALRVKKAKGERVGGIPFGWRVVVDPSAPEDAPARLERDETEQSTVAMVRELANEGYSTGAICCELAARRLRARNGKAFHRMQILRILKTSS